MVLSDLGTPAGQMSWSKALACRGADPGVALARVLGVSHRGHSGEKLRRIKRTNWHASPPLSTASEPEISLIWQQAACV
jgi:hypothetical protein